MIANTYTASFAATTLFSGGVDPFDVLFGFHVRTISPVLLSTVSIQFSWVDDRNVTLYHTELVALNLLNGSVQKAFPVRLGSLKDFKMAATLIGTAEYNIAYGQIGFN